MIEKSKKMECNRLDYTPLSGKRGKGGYAGVHLQRTGETMAPSFLRAAMALSTTLRSRPVSSAILPALTGSPALRMASSTIFFSSIIVVSDLGKSQPSVNQQAADFHDLRYLFT